MKAILIDPIRHSVGMVECTSHYTEIYRLLSDEANGLKVDTFTSVRINDRNCLWVDDNGLLKDPRYFFIWRGYQQPLAGRGLIQGITGGGDTVSTDLKAAAVAAMVRFAEFSVQGFEHWTGTIEIMGRPGTVIGQRAVFGPPKNS
jgi:hypothetical protein